MRSLVALALAATLFSMTFGSTAADASCVQANLTDQVARADVIAFGSVSRPVQLPIFPPTRQVRFRVERVFKGIAAGEINVALGPDGSAAATSVDYQADDGTAHTLYLRRTGDAYSTDACSGSHLGLPTAEETALLGAGGLSVVSGPAPAGSWVLPVFVAILALLLAAAAVTLSRRWRRTVEAQGQ